MKRILIGSSDTSTSTSAPSGGNKRVSDSFCGERARQRVNANLGSLRAAVCLPARHLGTVIRAGKPKRLPVVMAHAEVKVVINLLDGDKRLMASPMYGAGCRKHPDAPAKTASARP